MNPEKFLSVLSIIMSLAGASAYAANPAGNTSSNSAAKPAMSADTILKEVGKRVSSNDESEKVVMTITEANGTSKTREMEIKRKAGDAPKVLVKLLSPSDLRGTALLSVGGKGKAEDQWLYLPSTKQTRRIVSGNKAASFLDSEMSYEDMGSSSDKKFNNKLLRTEGAVAVIESDLVSGESNYSKTITWVNTDNYLINKIEYYDKKGALLKTTDMSDYKQFPGNVWRAQNIDVKNVQNHRSTKLQLKEPSVNKGIDDSQFSVNSLSSG